MLHDELFTEVVWYHATDTTTSAVTAAAAAGAAPSPSTSSAFASPTAAAAAGSAATPAAAAEVKKGWFDWKPMTATDSLKLEYAFRALPVTPGAPGETALVSVMNDLYDVNVAERIGTPVYWIGPSIRVSR